MKDKIYVIRFCGMLFLMLFMAINWSLSENAAPSLEEALAKIKVPPDWFKNVAVNYDTSHPWEDARLEVRRLLGEKKNHEAIKLTYLYVQKKDIGNGHEYPMYLFLGGEYAWALQEYKKHLAENPKGYTNGYRSLASCYVHFGEYDKAIQTLDIAIQRLPDPPWKIANEADVYDGYGDIYAKMGNSKGAKEYYQKAITLYPTSDQPYGRHLLQRQVSKVQSKIDLLDYKTLQSAKLRDGKYTGESLGYGEPITVEVTIKGGRISQIKLDHKEKIEQNATVIIPQRIIKSQSLKVDGITGATITCQGIIEGTFRALKKASAK